MQRCLVTDNFSHMRLGCSWCLFLHCHTVDFLSTQSSFIYIYIYIYIYSFKDTKHSLFLIIANYITNMYIFVQEIET